MREIFVLFSGSTKAQLRLSKCQKPLGCTFPVCDKSPLPQGQWLSSRGIIQAIFSCVVPQGTPPCGTQWDQCPGVVHCAGPVPLHFVKGQISSVSKSAGP